MRFRQRKEAKVETSLPGMHGIKWLTYRKFRFFLAMILLCFVFGGVVYAFRSVFDVTEIEFMGEGMNIQFNERLITGNIIFFPNEKVRRELLQEYPQLKDVIIKKKFPHTITILPVLRSAFAQLVTSKATYGIDEEGKIINIGPGDSALPQLTIDVPSVRVGVTVDDPNVQRALEFLKRSAALLKISVIAASDDGLSLRAVSDKTEILFTQSQNIETLMATLQTIITGVRIKGTMPKVIDVRFSKPVIKF